MSFLQSNFKQITRCVMLLVSGVLLSLPVNSQTVTGTGTVDSGTYNGSRARQYKVYRPQSYNGTVAVPMIFAVHGCAMDHVDALNLWNFDLIADQHNAIIVYPFVTSFTEQRSENCWGYWFDTHVQEGQGREVDDLYGMALEIESNYNIDPDRRYITGISSGGGMTVAAGIAYNDYWAAMAPAEAPAYGDGSNSVILDQFESLQFHVNKINAEVDHPRAMPTLVIHSTNDTTVLIRGGELIRDSQLTVWADDLNADGTEDCTAEGINCTLTTYNDGDGNPLVKTLFYDGIDAKTASLGKGHYWTGDDQARDLWAEEQGPSASQHIWAFFENYTLSGFSACEDPNDVTAPATPSNLSAFDVHDKYAVLTINPNSEPDLKGYALYYSNGSEAGFSSSSTMTLSGLSPETSYSVYAKAVDKCGNESAASNTVSFTTGPLEYIAPSAIDTVNGHYLAGRIDVNQMLDLGDTYGYSDSFTMWQLQNGTWTDVNPNGGEPGPTPTPNPTSTPTPTPTATPTPTPTPTPGCNDYTSSNSSHASSGRAYAVWGFYYYATGSGQYLGTGSSQTTLKTTDGGSNYTQGGC
ncbi:MAG: PHB depolymerase family esterase [Agarilytica sp.]